MYRNTLLFIISLCSFSHVFAQWKAVYYEPTEYQVFYDLAQDPLIKSVPIDAFYHFENQRIGYDLFGKVTVPNDTKMKLNISDGDKLFIKYFTNPIHFKRDTTCLKFKIFQKGLSDYSIFLHDYQADRWLKKDMYSKYEGYQEPVELFLTDFQNRLGNLLVGGICIVPHQKDAKIDVLQLRIFDQHQTEIVFDHPFINRVLDKEIHYKLIPKSENTRQDVHSPVLFEPEKRYGEEAISSSFFMKYDGGYNVSMEIALLVRIIDEVIDDYLFYDEHKINKDSLLVKWESLKNEFVNSNDLELFSRLLSTFIRTQFNDLHFYLEPRRTERNTLRTPVRLYPIRNKLIVAGVFDNLYQNSLPLGSEVISIDGISVNDKIKEYQSKEIGLPHYRKMLAISKLLQKPPTDSTILTYRKLGSDYYQDLTIYYNGTISVPTNFRRPHCHFEIIDSVSYFKINEFEEFTFMRFVNHLNDINRSKGLILDLRGNGGGDVSVCHQLLSLFTHIPFVYHHTDVLHDELKRKESTVILPDNQFLFREDFTVVILGDEFTGCASEDLILALKRAHLKTYFLSHSLTAGSLQNRYGIIFPSGNYMSLDCLSGKISSYGFDMVEGRGIEPDIWIQHGHYKDLAPYNDLLKLSAKRIIQSTLIYK